MSDRAFKDLSDLVLLARMPAELMDREGKERILERLSSKDARQLAELFLAGKQPKPDDPLLEEYNLIRRYAGLEPCADTAE